MCNLHVPHVHLKLKFVCVCICMKRACFITCLVHVVQWEKKESVLLTVVSYVLYTCGIGVGMHIGWQWVVQVSCASTLC